MRRAKCLFTGIATVTVALVLSGGLAMAAEDAIPVDKQAKMMEKHEGIDLNGDGKLTREEVRQFFRDRQQANQGGGPKGGFRGPGNRGGFGGPPSRPDPAELLKRHPELDTDGDGQLSKEELLIKLGQLMTENAALRRKARLAAETTHVLRNAADKYLRQPFEDTMRDYED